ncbi:MAG: hypothetical protein WC700_17310 [Gemmatimonadaceae bacterium]|jgi:hypothetical protein
MIIINRDGSWYPLVERREVAWGEIAMAVGTAVAAALVWVSL